MPPAARQALDGITGEIFVRVHAVLLLLQCGGPSEGRNDVIKIEERLKNSPGTGLLQLVELFKS